MNSIRNVFFDLDGTLVDPQEGITGCLKYALTTMGQPLPSQAELIKFIGPVLRDTFKVLLNTNDKKTIEIAVSFFRERYSTLGIYQNTIYPGILELLQRLKDTHNLYVATTKPEVYAKTIVKQFGTKNYFKGIYGTNLDGRFDDKAKLVKYILHNLSIAPVCTAIVGDRKHDIIAGKKNGIQTIGVTYGYGSLKEISDAKPDYICTSVPEIQSTLGVLKY